MQWVKGTTLQNGKYVIEDVLGQGGFGTTYKARHTEINHYVAIKTPNAFLKHDPDYEKYIKSFIKEAKRIAMMAREPHSHLVRFTDYFLEGDIPCLVMEFVDGTTLFEFVRQRGALPEPGVVKLLQEIGGALQWMHDRNLVHRDVNPANIMMCQSGRAVLIDLGIAQEISPTTRSSTKMSGNQGFAPYEQLMDGVRDVRCDVYSLAATAYFSVTGMRPPGSFQRKIKGEPLQEPVTRVALSGELNRAIVEGMALELGERPEDIARWVARVEPQPPPRVTVEPQPQPRERTTPPSSTPPVETAAPKQETVAPKQEVIISNASFIFTTETPPSLTQPVETAAPKQKATISNATFAIVSVLVFLGLVVLAVPLGMGNNLWVWAVVWVYAVVWAVIGAAAADRTVGAEAVIGAVAVAGAGAVIGAVAGALAIGFNLSLTGGLLVGCSLWFVGLIVGILNAGNIFVFYVFLVAPFASGVMASVLVDLELAVIAASTAGAITGGFPLGIFGITEVLSDRGYSKQQAAFMVSVLVTFGLSIGWLLGRFVFS